MATKTCMARNFVRGGTCGNVLPVDAVGCPECGSNFAENPELGVVNAEPGPGAEPELSGVKSDGQPGWWGSAEGSSAEGSRLLFATEKRRKEAINRADALHALAGFGLFLYVLALPAYLFFLEEEGPGIVDFFERHPGLAIFQVVMWAFGLWAIAAQRDVLALVVHLADHDERRATLPGVPDRPPE